MLIKKTEIQGTFILLMGLITSFLIFILPNYAVAGKVYNNSRKILATSTFLAMVHFIIQYILHKQTGNIVVTRTFINLLFSVPVTYLTFMSCFYIQRKGNISLHNWLFAPFIFVINLILAGMAWFKGMTEATVTITTHIMALLYTMVLFYYSILIYAEHRHILKDIKSGKHPDASLFVKHTRGNLLLMTLLSFGFPLMFFNTNLTMRSLYALLVIPVYFFYLISFIIYGIKENTEMKSKVSSGEEDESGEKKKELSVAKIERMNEAALLFVKKELFTQSSLTMKEAADAMGVSMNMFRIWLQNSKFEKYNNWITALRINKAKELMLKNPDFSYDEISDRCGFCDRQYFYRQFKKQEGVSPSVWIKGRIVFHEDQLKNEEDKEPDIRD